MDRKIRARNPEIEFVEIPYEESDFEGGEPLSAEDIALLRAKAEEWKKNGKPQLERLKKSYLYKVLDEVIDELIDNEDIIEWTARQNTVIAIISALEDENVLKYDAYYTMNESDGKRD